MTGGFAILMVLFRGAALAAGSGPAAGSASVPDIR